MGLNKTHNKFKELLEWSAKQYKKDPCDLTWNEMQKAVSNSDFNVDLQDLASRVGGFRKAKDALAGVKISQDSIAINSLAKDNKKKAKEDAELIFKMKDLEKTIVETFDPIRLNIKKINKTSKTNKQRALSLFLSDLHFGSDNEETTGVKQYGRIEEARSLAKVIEETCNYKPQYRKYTKLNLNILGDVIQGKLHSVEDAAALSEQCCRAIHLLTQAIVLLANSFPEVDVNFADGNHDRIKTRHPERATSNKWDSYSHIIYFAISNALKGCKNVKFNLTKKPFIEYSVFEKNIYCTHGDTVLKTGYPGNTIQVKQLENEINKLNAKIEGKKYSMVVVGHVHVGSIVHLSNGVALVTNGALTPPDQFSASLGTDPSAPSGQWLIESVPGYVCGDSRFITVLEKDRKDSRLDKIISPYVI
jgi:hypothetical protein